MKKIEVPERRPDGMFVVDKPPVDSPAERKSIMIGDRVYGHYHDLNRRSMMVSGEVVGFTRNDVMIYDKKLNSFVWIDGKNVYKLKSKRNRT